jgi:hypothetical protein
MTTPFYGALRPFRDGLAKAEPSLEERAAAERAATVEQILCAAMVRKGQASTMEEARRIRKARGE